MTICNMAVEAGATSGICYPDEKTVDYLWDFIKDEFGSKEEALKAYSKWRSDDDAEYEKVYTLDLSDLEPVCRDILKSLKTLPAGETGEKTEVSCTVSGRVNW